MGWNKSPELAIKDIESRLLADKNKIYQKAYGTLIFVSPVQDGVYRANQNASSGAPDYSFDPSKTAYSTSAPKLSANLGEDFFVANGAPYAGALENGHSPQEAHPFLTAYSATQRYMRELG